MIHQINVSFHRESKTLRYESPKTEFVDVTRTVVEQQIYSKYLLGKRVAKASQSDANLSDFRRHGNLFTKLVSLQSSKVTLSQVAHKKRINCRNSVEFCRNLSRVTNDRSKNIISETKPFRDSCKCYSVGRTIPNGFCHFVMSIWSASLNRKEGK